MVNYYTHKLHTRTLIHEHTLEKKQVLYRDLLRTPVTYILDRVTPIYLLFARERKRER